MKKIIMEVKHMLKYPRDMHSGVLWAKLKVLEQVFTPLF